MTITPKFTSTVHYEGNLRTHCTHVASQKTVITDAPVDNNGKGEAFSPTDLLATSLVSCMMTLMGITAAKSNIPFENADATMVKIMGTNPRRVIEIQIEITLKNQKYTPEQKQLLEDAAHNCPVAKSLHPDLKQTVTFIYS